MAWFGDKQYIERVVTHARELLPYCKRRNVFGFFIGAMLHPALYVEWFDFLENRLPRGLSSQAIGHLVEHTTRRYLRRWLRPQEKMAILYCHYNLIGTHFSPAAQEAMSVYPGALLAELIGKSGRYYNVTLRQYMTKEGEITLDFMDAEHVIQLATIRGTFGCEKDGRKVFWIGAIQGPPGERKAISEATRDLNVLRPKQAVLHALCAFCAWLNVDAIYAPPHENHISYRWWRPWFTRHKILSDYDGFWNEFTSRKTSWGDFYLSLPLSRRKIEDVQSKRRKNWVQRYNRIDALTENIMASLDALNVPPFKLPDQETAFSSARAKPVLKTRGL